MRLFDEEDNYLLEDDLSPMQDLLNKFAYYIILGKKLSFEIDNNDEKLFDVLRRELSEWLVCNGLATNDIKFEVDNDNTPVYEFGICRYGQYNPSEKKITLFNKNITDNDKDLEEIDEIKASTILHELMHAYFDCGLSRKPNLELIEEPLAEAGMLDFFISLQRQVI